MQLERFYTAKQGEVDLLRKQAEQGRLPSPFAGQRPDFKAAIQGECSGPVAVIAEYKRASPSRGVICEHLAVEDAVRQYAESGASCLSILTEEQYFMGSLDFLQRARNAQPTIPLLRKDFIFDMTQIVATAATPASALLLIVRLTPDPQVLRQLREKAAKYGMACVVEVFDEEDLRLARESGAEIIQVNARDLQTLKVDRKACLTLAQTCPPQSGEVWIQASGVGEYFHLVEAKEVGYSAVLVGTSLMEGGTPGKALHTLLQKSDN